MTRSAWMALAVLAAGCGSGGTNGAGGSGPSGCSQGEVRTCGLDTFSGSCKGSQMCQADGNWSACHAPSEVDDIDPEGTDSNCDGVDGVLADAILVATDGADGPACGTPLAPCHTVAAAMQRAGTAGLHFVLVQQGVYAETVNLLPGIAVVGGYAPSTWARKGSSRSTIDGPLDPATGSAVGVIAQSPSHSRLVSLTITTHLDPASADSGGNGHGAIALVVRGQAEDLSDLELEDVDLEPGPGNAGLPGMDGADLGEAPGQAAQGGLAGVAMPICDAVSRGDGGKGGASTCERGRDPTGGDGGRGGTADTSCEGLGSLTATDGEQGHDPPSSAGLDLGGPGGGGSNACGPGGDGHPGRDGVAGASGAGGTDTILLAVNALQLGRGQDGQPGENGVPGGGGGGSGGCDIGADSYGAGGGGGGAAGCGAQAVGLGGGAGGASLGLVALDSTVHATRSTIMPGRGGAGGRGGRGGAGQPGGQGGPGGFGADDSQAGGPGGRGGKGGSSGAGGGGAGGPSIGMVVHGSTIDGFAIQPGIPGAAGDGGASQPDGVPGAVADAGLQAARIDCVSDSEPCFPAP